MRSLDQCLLDTDWTRLQVIARFWDVDLPARRPRKAAPLLAAAMATPERIADIWEVLPPDQQQVLSSLVAGGGSLPRQVCTRQWGEIRSMGPARMERERPWLHPISPIEGLWYRGFIFSTFVQDQVGTYEVLLVPPELRPHIPTPTMSAPPTGGKAQAMPLRTSPIMLPTEPPPYIHSSGEQILDDVCTLLSYFQNEAVRLSADGHWPQYHSNRLSRQLHSPHPQRLEFICHLLQQAGWLRRSTQGHLRPTSQVIAEWLQSTAYHQRMTLATIWREDSTWSDLFHVPSLRPEKTGTWHHDPLLARHTLLNHMKDLPWSDPKTPNADWYLLADLITSVKSTLPDFLRPDGDYRSWYIRDVTDGRYLTGFESWDAVEGALIRYIVTGPLFWLGMVDLGGIGPSEEAVTHFRLTADGATFIGLTSPATYPEAVPTGEASGSSTAMDLRPDFTITIVPAKRYERFQLARIATWERTGDPFIYRITPTSLERARRQGISLQRIIGFLEEGTGRPLPSAVRNALARWETQGTEVQLEEVLLLRLASEGLMAQVMNSAPVRRFIRERIGPTVAVVCKKDAQALIAALGKIGLLCKWEGKHRSSIAIVQSEP